MAKKAQILEIRERLDKTLSLPKLVNKDTVKSLVKNQLLRSAVGGDEEYVEDIVEKRAMEVSNILEMLRSSSRNEREQRSNSGSNNEWKIKQDSDELRVMYREGPHGTPFHTLLAEGCVDGPVDICLCLSWESDLYENWWPQYNVPPFKILKSFRLKKVRIGEDITLVRVKVPWPVSVREALLHFFEIDFPEEDLVVVLFNTISDIENISLSTHGFTRDEIPEAEGIVRVDLVGGFVLQKISSSSSYFRTIANMDIKLDFVPPWLINFISRQLIGTGHKLYNKAVRAVTSKGDAYKEALKEPMYVRIRESLDSCRRLATGVVVPDVESTTSHPEGSTLLIDTEIPAGNSLLSSTEIEVQHLERSHVEESQIINSPSSTITEHHDAIRKGDFVSPEVVHALQILDRAIDICRRQDSLYKNQNCCLSSGQDLHPLDAASEVPFVFSQDKHKDSGMNQVDEAQVNKFSENSRRDGSASESPCVEVPGSIAVKMPSKSMQPPPVVDFIGKVCDEGTVEAASGLREDTSGSSEAPRRNKFAFCCFGRRLS